MKNSVKQLAVAFLMLAACSLSSELVSAQSTSKPEAPLLDVISALDKEVFDAFNHCDDTKQLIKHTNFFSTDVEFYHDNGGVTWTRAAMINNTKRHVCGNYQREIIAGSLKVFPIKGFGAIAQGVHKFCSIKTGKCDGMADFVIVWKHHNDQWKITRVLSYGHRENN